MRRALLLLLLAGGLAGCTKTQAKTPVPPPALSTPEPPDRVIVPAPIPEPAEPAPAPPPAPVAPARPRETPPPRPDRPAAPTPAPAVPPAAEPPPSPPILQTTTNPGEVEQRAHALIETANHDLDRINPAQLTSNARAQYNTAKGFIRQAEDALKVKNVVLARDLADKAAALASQLRR